MGDSFTIDGLRAALQKGPELERGSDDVRFEALARRFEAAVHSVIAQIKQLVDQIPELQTVLEDEIETFTSPAFPGRSVDIRDQRLRIIRGDDMLLFDPTAKALLSALGQIEIEATRPIPFLVERVLYLIPDHDGKAARWGFRSVETLGGPLVPFSEKELLRMLHAVFAAS